MFAVFVETVDEGRETTSEINIMQHDATEYY